MTSKQLSHRLKVKTKRLKAAELYVNYIRKEIIKLELQIHRTIGREASLVKPFVTQSVWKLKSQSRYNLFNKIIDSIRQNDKLKDRTSIFVFRDRRKSGISVKVGLSYNQGRISERVRKQFRRLADKVSVSYCFGHGNKRLRVERYIFKVLTRRQKLMLEKQK